MKISVCMATYNGEKYISKQIESILKQLKPNDEIIISDDGSTDNTAKIINSFNDVRIKFLKHKSLIISENYKSITDFKRHRLIKNFENALVNSSGGIIFLSDQDDVWYENKVTEIENSLKTSDLVVSDCSIIDKNEKILVKSRFEIKNPKLGFLHSLYKNPYLGCCMAFKKEILTKALPFPKDIPMHDIWLGIVAKTFYKPALLNKVLVGYRRHDQNINNNINSNSLLQRKNVSQYNFLTKIKFRISLLKNLFILKFGLK